jgi:hypothetical protein
MNQDLTEPVFQQDIDTEHEYATEGWKNFFEFYTRLKAQGAPPELLNKVVEITNIYKNLTESIAGIQQCFPVEKRR